MAIGEGDSKKTGDEFPTNQPAMVSNSDYDSLSSMDIYEFMTQAYEGTGGFRDGRYLVPHSTELKMTFERRRDLAFYKNYVNPIIRATLDPVFNAEIKRQILVAGKPVTKGYLSTAFLEDATGDGQGFQEFVDSALTKATIHEVSFVVMDNVPKAELAASPTTSKAIQNRAFPYVFLRTMEQLDACELNRLKRLVWVRFYEGTIEKKTEAGTTYNQKQYSFYDAVNVKKQYADEKGDIHDYPDGVVPHGLGMIPVIVVYHERRISKSKKRIECDPTFYDIARINHAVFNKDSEIRSQERAQGFAVFYVQEDKAGNLIIGRHNYLSLPMATTIPPGFACPPPEILAGLVKNNESLREDLFRIAGQKGVDFRSSQVKSGDALEWEFIAQEVVLKKTARRAMLLEYAIMYLFKAYSKEDFTFDVEYPEQFRPDSEENELADLDKLLIMGMPARVKAYIQKQAFMIKAKRWPEDEVKALLPDFDMVRDEGGGEGEPGRGGGNVVDEKALTDTLVKDTTLNGAQIASLVQIVTECAKKQLPIESAKAIIKAAFPALDETVIMKIIGPLKSFKPAEGA